MMTKVNLANLGVLIKGFLFNSFVFLGPKIWEIWHNFTNSYELNCFANHIINKMWMHANSFFIKVVFLSALLYIDLKK